MLEKMEVGKDTKECFAEMSKNRKMQDGLGSKMMQLDAIELQKSIEELRYRKCKTAFHNVTGQWFQEYLQRGNLLLHPHAIGLWLDSGEDPYSPILAQLLETFYFCSSPSRDLQLLHPRSWTCSFWEPSLCHEFRLEGYERA